MGRKRHASEYLADSGSVSSASTSKMPSGKEKEGGTGYGGEEGGEQEKRAVARAESVEGWLLLRLIQSTATLPVGRRSFRRIFDAPVDRNCRRKKLKQKGEQKRGREFD